MTTSTERVFVELRERIVSGALEAGSQHSIYRLADELEVSRTPVREAVLRLADLGLVAVERNRGVRIKGVTVDDVRSVFELRLLLEVPVSAHAASTPGIAESVDARLEQMRAAEAAGDEAAFNAADRRFHAVVASAFANPRLESEVDRLRDTIQARGVSTIGRSRPMAEIVDEHALVADAVRNGDPVAAAARMTDHLERTGYLLMRQVADDPDGIEASWADRVRGLLGTE